jgi:hypothetical protein
LLLQAGSTKKAGVFSRGCGGIFWFRRHPASFDWKEGKFVLPVLCLVLI